MNSNKYIYALAFIAILIGIMILPACANMGHPSGGPYDMTPPVFLKSTPQNKSKNVDINTKKIKLYFDENIKIEDPSKIIITPLQIEQPEIFANAKKITITFVDSIRKNTTYGLFFDDAIADNNEDNPLDDFYYTFSTGDSIDSMRVSGVVLDAETLEPIDMLTVGAHQVDSINDDSLEMKKPFIFGSKTNKMGEFTIFALDKKNYKISAINDIDQNFKLSQQGEGVALLNKKVKPYLIDSIKIDTITRDSVTIKGDTIHLDSLVKKPFTYYYPNNLILRYYNAEDKRCGIKESKLIDSSQISIEFVENLDTIPHLTLIGSDSINGDFYIPSLDKNKVTYWLKNKNFVNDSIAFSLKHSKNDSILNVYTDVDTIRLFRQKKYKRDTIKPVLNIEIKQTEGQYKNTPKDSIYLILSQPVENLDSSYIKFNKIVDSTAINIPYKVVRHGKNILRYDIIANLNFNSKYKLLVDSAKLKSIYGITNNKTSQEFKISPDKDLSSLSLMIQNIDSNAICQLLDNSGNVLESKKVTNITEKELKDFKEMILSKDSISKKLEVTKTIPNSINKIDSIKNINNDTITNSINDSITLVNKKIFKITFENINPAKYYIRLFIDSNNDGKWTTGKYPYREPEMMYYCNNVFDLKKGMTTQEEWDVKALPLNEQKPLEIRKVKPQEKKKRVDKNIEYYKNLKSGGGQPSNTSSDIIDPRSLL